ncbi:MAG: aminopeptidase N [Proteobacteria bacterium]|nr:MAG: aminopeptidase N [Pseudomonadota bacterium]
MSIRIALTSLVLCLLSIQIPKAQAQAKLTHEQSKTRSEQVSDVRYDLSLDISKGDREKSYTGEVVIDFVWKASKEPLRIDFSKGEVKALAINGKKAVFSYDKEAIVLKPGLLSEGPNKITVSYRHPYSIDGSGLYRFTDPEDKRTYLYSQFETFDANQMLPNFDQPDLKAKFTLKVLAPKDWTVVSAVRENKIDVQKSARLWTFPESLPISSYVFSLHAGPYKIWEDSKFRIPLRVMARQSLAQYVKPEEWLNWTRFGFDFFEKTFGTPYPFLKYDQILVPDFNAGAMENVAAVTYNERFAPKGERSARAIERNFSTLLHEMAHMWFGDLVTMKWWDDLWLNESFATYAAAWALESHPDYKHAWVSFHQEKNWGYYADRLTTTHPIVADIADTDVAGSTFDGITYGKGASWLKLLAFRVGEDNFKAGLKAYFSKHAFGNSTVNDLMASLEIDPKLKLAEFSKSWLHTAGLNSIEVRANCSKDAKLESLEVLQTASTEHPDLRPHSMIVALYAEPGSADQWLPYKTVRVDYESAKTTVPVEGSLACPSLVMPNATDDDFVKIVWPSEQLPRIQGDLERIADPIHRTLFWEHLGWALDDGQIPLEDAIRFTVDHLPLEKNYAVLMNIQDFLQNHVIDRLAEFSDKEARSRYAKTLAQPFEKMLVDSQTAKDFRLLAFDFYIPLLSMSGDKEALAKILEKKTVWPEFKLDQPSRWLVLKNLATLNDPRVSSWAKLEKTKDKSDEGALQLLGIEASLLSDARKAALIQSIVDSKSTPSRAQVRASFQNIFPAAQSDSRKAFREVYLKTLPKLSKHKEEFLRSSYLLALLPSACDESDESLFTEILKIDWPAYVKQDLLEKRDNLRYCRTIRTNAAAAAPQAR